MVLLLALDKDKESLFKIKRLLFTLINFPSQLYLLHLNFKLQKFSQTIPGMQLKHAACVGLLLVTLTFKLVTAAFIIH